MTQLSATSTSRAAFMQCLRWGIWCPFQEPDDGKGREIRLVLHGGALPNPYGIMVYSAQTTAKPQSTAPTSPPDAAQVTRQQPEVKDTRCKQCVKRRWAQQPLALTQMFPPSLLHYLNCVLACGALGYLISCLYWVAFTQRVPAQGHVPITL